MGLEVIKRKKLVPPGYGIREEEWGEERYPCVEEIVVGSRKKSIPVRLPESIWIPKARLWAQGLYVMQHNMYSKE